MKDVASLISSSEFVTYRNALDLGMLPLYPAVGSCRDCTPLLYCKRQVSAFLKPISKKEIKRLSLKWSKMTYLKMRKEEKRGVR